MHALSGWPGGESDAGMVAWVTWLCCTGGLALLSGLCMRLLPGVRTRRVFAAETSWVWRFFTGNFSLGYTLWCGGCRLPCGGGAMEGGLVAITDEGTTMKKRIAGCLVGYDLVSARRMSRFCTGCTCYSPDTQGGP